MLWSKLQSWFKPTADTTNLPPFGKFLELPPEIQIHIWEAVCEHGRTVTVYKKNKTILVPHSKTQGYLEYFFFKSHDPIPQVMQVSHMARKTAQRVYKLAFDTRAQFPEVAETSEGANATIWVNPEVDIICPIGIESMTVQQRQTVATQMFALRVSRIGLPLNATDSGYPSNQVFLHVWIRTFISQENGNSPAWLSGSVKEVFLYRSISPIFPGKALSLAAFDYETAKRIKSLERQRSNQIRQFNDLMKGLEGQQIAQKECDESTSSRGEQRVQVETCPTWLYDFCETKVWRKPEIKIVLADTDD